MSGQVERTDSRFLPGWIRGYVRRMAALRTELFALRWWRQWWWVGFLLVPWFSRAAGPGGTRFFLTNEVGRSWLVPAGGRPFFSLGVCVVNQGIGREQYDPENPGYAAWQHYPTAMAWADESLSRLKGWGFTTVGGWGDTMALRQATNQTLWLTPVLHVGSTAGAPWWDMWDPKNVRRMETVAREGIVSLRGDARVVGYYSDNELGWWNATLWKLTLEQPATSGQRQRLVKLLRTTYADDWSRLLVDFDPENAGSWAQLQRGGMLFVKPGGNGVRVLRQFLGLLADRYYGLMRGFIRQFDPGALYLGDRYQSFFYPEVARAAAGHVDAVSSNLNAQFGDGTFLRSYLDTLHALTGKPVLITELYAAATDNRSGNRNDYGTYPVTGTQAERAALARTTLNDLLRLPYVVGADWFQFADEPRHGREDGENFNFGLVDIRNQPYAEVTQMFATLDPDALRVRPVVPRPDALAGIPPAPAQPFANFKPPQALRQWDRERGYVPPVTAHPLSDLYVSWSPGALYLGLYSLDIVESAYYRNPSVPKSDRALFTVRLGGKEIVRARLGAGREPLANEPRVRIENSSGMGHNVSNVAALELSAELLGRPGFAPGDEVELDCSLDTHGRAHRVEWRGRYRLAR